MKKLIAVLFALIVSISANSQEKKEGWLKKTFKYSTFYGAYSQTNSVQAPQTFIVTQDNNLIETTKRHPSDMMVTYGWRKLAHFQYEDRDKFYDGDEKNASVKSNIGAYKGLEYLIEYSRGRQQGNEFVNKEMFLRYLSNYWLVKGEYQKNELVDIDYKSAELRLRLPIGKKFSISAGSIYRTYEKAYGHNPIQKYLEENAWWELAYQFHTDQLYEMIDPFTEESLGYDYLWYNQAGQIIAASDADYRNGVFQNVVNRYNREQLSMIGGFADLAAVIGVDFYHYKKKFWVHLYGNVLGKHQLMSGDERYSYNNFVEGDWIDYSAGGVFGFRLGKLGVFSELTMQRYWGREIKEIKIGLNYKL